MTTVGTFTRTEADDVHIDLWINGDQIEVDRNYRPLREGQIASVLLRFHFDESWAERVTKIVSLLNASRIYTLPMHHNRIRVPAHMLHEGFLKIIVRGFKMTEDLNVVVRNGHIIVTQSPISIDEPAYIYTDRFGGFSASDNELSDRKGWAYEKPNDHWVASDETIYKETHDIPPVTEDETGYMEASLITCEAIYVGRKRI